MAILNIILNIVYTILILGVLVFVHELGHFMAARSVGLPVITFSIGMGPALKKWKWKRFGDTEFRISAVPFGGYCMVSGEEDTKEEGDTYYSKNPWQRIWYSSAGVLMNFALAIVVFIFVFAVWGQSVAISDTNQMGAPIPSFPAEKAGIDLFDRILLIDGEYIDDYVNMAEIVNANPGVELDFIVATPIDKSIGIELDPNDLVMINFGEETKVCEIDLDDTTLAYTLEHEEVLVAMEDLISVNDSEPPMTDERDIDWVEIEGMLGDGSITLEFDKILETRELAITPVQDENSDEPRGLIGISPYTTRESIGLINAIKLGFLSIWRMLGLIWAFFLGLFKGKTAGLGGPKAIYQIVTLSATEGIARVLEFMGMLSVMLGFINLVPFPGLDGGHILFNLFEGVSGKKINRNVLNTINYIGFLLLMGLMALIVIRDFII